MVLVQKWPFYQLFFFRQYRPGKSLLRYSRTIKCLFRLYKIEVQKVKKIHIFPKGLMHGFGPKMTIFQPFFFLDKIGQENVFYDILERKNASLGYKNKKFKQSKNWQFFKGVNRWFWSKNGHFSKFLLSQYSL